MTTTKTNPSHVLAIDFVEPVQTSDLFFNLGGVTDSADDEHITAKAWEFAEYFTHPDEHEKAAFVTELVSDFLARV